MNEEVTTLTWRQGVLFFGSNSPPGQVWNRLRLHMLLHEIEPSPVGLRWLLHGTTKNHKNPHARTLTFNITPVSK